MKKTIHVAVGLAISVVCLWFTFRGFDFDALREQTTHFSLVWLIPASLIYCVSFALRSARWRWILSPIRAIPYWIVAPSLIFGFLMNTVLPARGGEVARAFAVSRKGGIPVSSALGSVVAERTLDIFGLITIMVVAARLLPWEKLPVLPILASLGVLLAVMGIGLYVLPKLPVGRSAGAKKLKAFFLQLGAGFSVIRKPSQVIGLIAVSVVIWIFDAASVMSLSRAAGLTLTFPQSAALNVGLAVGVMIPAAPGYVGTYEFFGKQILTMLGFPVSAALTFVVFLHFFQMAMIVVIMGLPSTLLLGIQPDISVETKP